ncbi:AAA family ATPase [Kitasatospora sp. NPDC059795]|uniref:AAA family ATPase n=1 Tax=Kitasatospora sp. NPDC059795 TaxID=3346949 RepID=UPI00364CDEAA
MVANPPVVIGIAGTHSTGKTTLAKRIEMELRAAGLNVARTSGLARRAAELGFPKMLRHTVTSTEWIITAGSADTLAAGIDADVVIVDRTPHDALAYLHAAMELRREQPVDDELHILSAIADLHTREHALLLATVLDPDIPLGEHPRKDPAYTDTAFRAAVDWHLHSLLSESSFQRRLRAVTYEQHDAAVQTAVATVHTRLAVAS